MGMSLERPWGGRVGLVAGALWGKGECLCVIAAILTALATKLKYERASPSPLGRNQSPKGDLSCQHELRQAHSDHLAWSPFYPLPRGDLAFWSSSRAGMALKDKQQVNEVIICLAVRPPPLLTDL